MATILQHICSFEILESLLKRCECELEIKKYVRVHGDTVRALSALFRTPLTNQIEIRKTTTLLIYLIQILQLIIITIIIQQNVCLFHIRIDFPCFKKCHRRREETRRERNCFFFSEEMIYRMRVGCLLCFVVITFEHFLVIGAAMNLWW